jgi:hypothetical protein
MELNSQVAKGLVKLALSSEQSALAATMMAEHVTGKVVPKAVESQADV